MDTHSLTSSHLNKIQTNETIRKYINTETLNYIIHSVHSVKEKKTRSWEKKLDRKSGTLSQHKGKIKMQMGVQKVKGHTKEYKQNLKGRNEHGTCETQ